jgi:N-acyl-D-aspartate/D-glutamate deacylase
LNNFGDHTNSAAHRMLTDPNAVWGLGDAGAHSTIVADCSFPTLALTYWVRDRDKDDPRRLSIEYAIKKLTSDNAQLFGLHDRGVLKPGRKADVNLINLAKLTLHTPQMLFDLPLGMPRVVQSADGFEATFVSGRLVQQRGELTGAQPGKVARSSAPVA